MTGRMIGPVTGLALLATGLVGTATGSARAQAKGPTFDCAKATGTVETLICADEGLAALDRKLDAVYKAALAKARDGLDRTLRAEQRGWVKGRNECWKAQGADSPVFLTESWQATSVRACVEGQYQLRTSELQVWWQLVPARDPVSFVCNNNPANEIVVTFFDTDPSAGRFEWGDRTVVAWHVRSGSGAKYEGQNLSFWNKGREAMVTWLGDELKCEVR